MKRNPFFMPSGFESQEAIDIIEGAGDNRKRLEKIKGRKKSERKLHKQVKRKGNYRHTDNCKSAKTDQIQYGIDLAKWWGEQHE